MKRILFPALVLFFTLAACTLFTPRTTSSQLTPVPVVNSTAAAIPTPGLPENIATPVIVPTELRTVAATATALDTTEASPTPASASIPATADQPVRVKGSFQYIGRHQPGWWRLIF